MRERVEEALEILRKGGMVILTDDEHRENEGDLCMLAEKATPEAINFMARYGRGLICVTMTQERLSALGIPPMVSENTSRFHTAFTVSIEAAHGVTTGISAADRAHTIRVAADPDTKPSDLARPGHIFPIAARPGGVLERVGQTEGSVDLARLCGARVAAGVICEIMKDDGTMARMPDLELFAKEHGLIIITIADLIAYRLEKESLVEEVSCQTLHAGIAAGFEAHIMRSLVDKAEHLALTYHWNPDAPKTGKAPLIRVHGGSLWDEILGDTSRSRSLKTAIERIKDHGCGVILYISQKDNHILSYSSLGESPAESIETSQTEEERINAVAPETRWYGVGAQCLRHLGLSEIVLLTDAPKKMVALSGFGLRIIGHLALSADKV